jgi:hypothetical protein
MAKYSMKMKGKEVGPASLYAEPHTMKGKLVTIHNALEKPRDPNTLSANQLGPRQAVQRVSAGDPARDDVKTTGIKMRGVGAATKGVMSRGPMG